MRVYRDVHATEAFMAIVCVLVLLAAVAGCVALVWP